MLNRLAKLPFSVGLLGTAAAFPIIATLAFAAGAPAFAASASPSTSSSVSRFAGSAAQSRKMPVAQAATQRPTPQRRWPSTCVEPFCNHFGFIENIPEADWVNIDLSPSQGTAAIKAALNTAASTYPTRPVRIRLAAGVYQDNLGAEIFAQRLMRDVTSPIWLLALDATPNATRLEQGINLLGVSYMAIEGVTIGPPEVGAWDATNRRHADPQPLQAAAGIHVAGAALLANQSANNGGTLNSAIYGQYEASHHILVRNVTIQNLFELDAENGETSQGQGMDGMKFNQVKALQVKNSSVRQTSRHGIDNVGVHSAEFSGNVIAHTGGGQGLEAKGGSRNVVVDGNVFYRVRRVALGGENTDATYYFSSDGSYTYEAQRFLLRNNLIIDPREAAMDFAGCLDCSALGNTVLYSANYQVPVDQGTVYGGDAIRIHDSQLIGTQDGAGSDCQFWNGSDYVTIATCWGVGSNAPAPIGRVLATSNVTVYNNVFISTNGHFGNALGGSTQPCPLNVIDGNATRQFDFNYWYNGNQPLPASGCTALEEGASSVYSTTQASAATGLGSSVLDSSVALLARSAMLALTPMEGSVLAGRGWFGVGIDASSLDFNREYRATSPAKGAIEALPATTALVLGKRSDYTLQRDGSNVSLLDGQGATQSLGAVNRIRFADSVLALDVDGAAGKGYRIYQAAFNRVPDSQGLGYWIGWLDRGLRLLDVASGFVNSAEFNALYGENSSDETFVTRLYNNVLHREPEPGGFAFWINSLRVGVSRAQVLADFSESAENKGGVAQAISNGISYTLYNP